MESPTFTTQTGSFKSAAHKLPVCGFSDYGFIFCLSFHFLFPSPTISEFAKLTQSLWTSVNNEAISPSDFRSQIQRYAPKFVGCK